MQTKIKELNISNGYHKQRNLILVSFAHNTLHSWSEIYSKDKRTGQDV